MTGFARETTQGPWGELSWELRSVNHRYLDLSLRLPEELRALESDVRSLIAEKVGRGKLEANLRLRAQVTVGQALEVNAQRLQELAQACHVVGAAFSHTAPVDPLKALSFPGVLREQLLDAETLAPIALELLGRTLISLAEMRTREGERLVQLMSDRLDTLAGLVATVRARLPMVREESRARLQARVQEILGRAAELDQGRLEQELAILVQRLDIDEELVRLDSHIVEVRQTLKRKEAVGRRLDFLMQELNREANTLSSKSQDTEVTRAGVEMKVVIEQIREQVQNVE
ncbi:MAG: YicC/YloC family endoribonuclease [Nevskiales bacterium]